MRSVGAHSAWTPQKVAQRALTRWADRGYHTSIREAISSEWRHPSMISRVDRARHTARRHDAAAGSILRVEGGSGARTLEVLVPVKVRKGVNLSSSFVRLLPPGTRVRVIESRNTADGERVCVCVGDECRPLGWATARRTRLGEMMLRELTEEEVSEEELSDFEADADADASSRVDRTSARTRTAHGRPPSQRAALTSPPLSSQRSSQHEGDESSPQSRAPWPPTLKELRQRAYSPMAPARRLMAAAFFSSSNPAADGTAATPMGGQNTYRMRSSDAAESAPYSPPRGAGATPPQTLGVEVGGLRGYGAASQQHTRPQRGMGPTPQRQQPPPNARRATTTPVSTAGGVLGGGGASSCSVGAQAADAPGTTSAGSGGGGGGKGRGKNEAVILASSKLVEEAETLKARAAEEEAKLADKMPLETRVGVALTERIAKAGCDAATFLNDLVREWDPNRDGKTSKVCTSELRASGACP